MQNCCKKDFIENAFLHSLKAELNSILTGKEKKKYFLKMLSFPSTCSIVISGESYSLSTWNMDFTLFLHQLFNWEYSTGTRGLG